MNKKTFELATGFGVFVVVTPIAWYVYTRYSGVVQVMFIAACFGVVYLVKKLFYEPIRARLPGGD